MRAGLFAPAEVAYLHTLTPLSERIAYRVVRARVPLAMPFC